MKDIHEVLNCADGIEVAQHLKGKSFSAVELLETVIERAEKVNPQINAISEMNWEYARQTVKKVNLNQSCLAGIPTFFKDLFASCQGMSISNGSRALGDIRADIDDNLITRYKAAGLIMLGSSTSPEFGTSYTTESTRWGATRSPWNLEHSAGGSSGGAAAIVAARIVPFAHGNDGGGSLRVPASCCGIFGLKPSRGLMPSGPFVGEGWAGFGTPHAVTLSVRDSAALLDLSAGADAGAPYAAPAKPPSYLSMLATPVKKLKVALVEDILPWGVRDDAKQAVRHAAKLCESLGHEIEVITLPIQLEKFLQDCFTIIGVNTQDYLHLLGMIQGKPVDLDLLEPRTRVMLKHKANVSGVDYVMAVNSMHALGRTFTALHEKYDVILTPTLANAPPKIGQLDRFDDSLSLDQVMEAFHSYCPFTAIFNATGQPAMSVPLYWTAEGLPIGAHFAGRFGDETTLLQLARQLELAQPWIGKIPPVSAAQ